MNTLFMFYKVRFLKNYRKKSIELLIGYTPMWY